MLANEATTPQFLFDRGIEIVVIPEATNERRTGSLLLSPRRRSRQS